MEVLVFLQTSSENPLIQGYLMYLMFTHLVPVTDFSGPASRLLPYLFLYKAGYDFRGLLVLEEYFYTNERLLHEIQGHIERKESITPWIEHFIQSIMEIIQKIDVKIGDEHGSMLTSNFFDLTERQKEILVTFDAPGSRITNKKVQQLCGISKITASRDLARLAHLGFLFAYGKGRSVYYMKV